MNGGNRGPARAWADRCALAARSRWAPLFAVWAVVIVVPDLVSRGELIALPYALSLVASLGLWALAVSLIAWLRARAPSAAIVAAVLCAALITTLAHVAHGYHAFFLKDIRALDWQFALDAPMFSLTLVATAMGLRGAAIMAAMMLALSAGLLWAAGRAAVSAARLPAWYAAPILGFAAVTFVRAYPLTAELTALRAMVFGTYARARTHESPQMLPVPDRVLPERRRAARSPDVVLLVHESLGAAESLREGGRAVETARFLDRHHAHALWFPRAESAATATCVSLPTILTGLHPDAPREAFARAPLLWHAARAVGYTSALFSAQEYNFELFQQYFLGPNAPDVARTASDYVAAGAPRVNEMGVDDALAVDSAIQLIRATPLDQPFVVVVQLNGTHWPCWAPGASDVRWASTMVRGNDATRCAAATRYVDAQTARIFAALEERGSLERTLIVGTSDHGEVFRPGRPSRRYSFYEDVLAVPLFVHLPADLADRADALHANAEVRVSNLDIYPTLLDVWGLDAASGVDLWAHLAGRSLLRPIGDRVLTSLSDSTISKETTGFAVFHGRWKWVVSEHGGVQLFDLDADPGELHDLAASAPEEEVRAFREEVAKSPRLSRIFVAIDAHGAARSP